MPLIDVINQTLLPRTARNICGSFKFYVLRFVYGQCVNMPGDRKFIQKKSPWNLFRLHCCYMPCDNVVMVCCALSAFNNIFKKGCWIRKQTTYRRSIASVVQLLQPVTGLPLCKLDIPNRCTKVQSLKKRKIIYLCYSASSEENSAGFLGNHFCKWLPVEAGRCPSAPGHCTGFMCSKHTTSVLKPFGAGLLGCECRGHSSYCSIQG